MRPILVPAIVAILASALPAQSFNRAANPKIGEAAPPLAISQILGGKAPATLTWDALKGKTVVLEFWATWCGPCLTSLPKLNTLAGDTGAVVIAISGDPIEKVRRHHEAHANILFALDEADATFASYNPGVIPHTVLVGPDGLIKAIASPEDITAQVVRDVAAGKPVDVPVKGGRRADLEWDLKAPFNPDGKEPESQSIIERTSCQGGGSRRKPGGRSFTADGAPIGALLGMAYDTTMRRMEINLPQSLMSQQYRVSIWVPPGQESTLMPALKAAIERDLPIQVRNEPRKRDVYLLRPADGGAKLTASTSKPEFQMLRGQIKGRAMKIDRLRATLENFSAAPVLDDTGLAETYDFDLSYDPGNPGLLKTQLTEKLGLTLVKETREVETLVVTLKE